MRTRKKPGRRLVPKEELEAMNRLADELLAKECLSYNEAYDLYCNREKGHQEPHYAKGKAGLTGYRWV